jgi:uncharacterized membrane protein YbaN (DUF454 family)
MPKGDVIRFLRILLGIFFIILGIAGLFVPIFPDWILILVGLSILGYVPAKRLLKKLKKLIKRIKRKLRKRES